jgi:hypothetical protein
MRFKAFSIPAILITLLAGTSGPSVALPLTLMYGGLGGHSNGDSTNDGALAIVDQTTGVATVVGHPGGVARISGLTFDTSSHLFGATQSAGGFPPPPGPTSFSNLIQLDPLTGALQSSVPIITTGGISISIADLAAQPGTNTLYGIRGPNDQLNGQGLLYTINPLTGVATLVGDTGDFFGSIAFSPNGTLFMSSADLDANDNLTNISIKTLNPNTAATLTAVSTTDFFGALAVRPTDSVIFGDTGDSHQLFTVNAVTGAETLVGDTGRNFVGDLAFETVPEPGTLTSLSLGLLGICYRTRSRLAGRQDSDVN